MKNFLAIFKGSVSSAEKAKADRSGISDIENRDTAYVIVKANSHDEAAKYFTKHPHFMIFPGDSIEIMECLPMPGAPN